MLLTHLALITLAQNPNLAVILERLGDAEKRMREAPVPCAYREVTKVEELDGNGGVWGWETHVNDVERRGDFHPKPISVTRGGNEIDQRLRPKRDDELSDDEKRKRRDFRTAFHRDEQSRYRFEVRDANDPHRISVWFEPKQPNQERFKGTVVIDSEAMRLVSIDAELSWRPPLVWEFNTHLDFERTPCGEQATRVSIKGAGGFLFVKKRFRSFVTRQDFRLLP